MTDAILTDATVDAMVQRGGRLIRKPITRETALEERGRPLVVTLHPRYLQIRRKGTQEVYNVTYDAIYSMAAKVSAMMRLSR